jgi:Fe-S cluster assembly protein SufD
VSETLVSTPPATLSREAVQRLSHSRQEPEWLLEVRLRALDAYHRLPLPDQRTEGWRRTSLRGLNLDALEPWTGGAHLSVSGDSRAVVIPLDKALQDTRLAPQVERHFGHVVAPDTDKFVAFHYAFFNAGVVIVVPRGTVLDEPIWTRYEGDGPVLAHTLVILEDEAELPALVEEFRDGSEFASNVVEQVVGANAHLRYVQLNQYATEVWNFSTQRATLAQDASLRTLNAACGGRTTRNAVQVVLEGRGSQADLLGIVDIGGRQHADFETLQDHYADATRSDLVIHNALRDRASANFTGLIRINKSARQTESSQEQKNILLSDAAKADSDPKLEILNNDVIRCTHGAAVGPVDSEMVFYLQSRGLDRAGAEQLIVDGFFQSTLSRLALPSLEERIWSVISEVRSRE